MIRAKNYEIVSKCVKVMTKNKVAPFYLGHGVCMYKLDQCMIDKEAVGERQKETTSLCGCRRTTA